MKRILLFALVALMSISANAQFYSQPHDGGGGLIYLSTFKDGLKGEYGIGWDLYGSSGFGCSFSILTTLGMNGTDNFTISGLIGPNYTYFFTDNICFSFPVQLGVNYGGWGDLDLKKKRNENKAIFALLTNPYMGFYAGPVQIKVGPFMEYLAHNIDGLDKVCWGAHVGLYLDF